jgi:hypothetical protein
MIFRSFIFACIILQAVVFASIKNGRFEIADPNGATPYFTPPLHWTTENFAGLKSNFIPKPEYGQAVTWTIDYPFQGDFFCLLSTGDILGPGSDSMVTRSSIQQQIGAESGDTLMGFYYFGTCDYMPYNDTANIKLTPVDPNDGLRDILLATISVADVGNYNSTEQWLSFTYTFTSQTQGQYILSCEVIDIRDTKYKSYLAVDNFRICYDIPLYGDINFDCGVDLKDLNIFSHLWLSDCNDPNTYDPNFVCSTADFNCNSIIDPNDLILMSNHWLESYWSE